MRKSANKASAKSLLPKTSTGSRVCPFEAVLAAFLYPLGEQVAPLDVDLKRRRVGTGAGCVLGPRIHVQLAEPASQRARLIPAMSISWPISRARSMGSGLGVVLGIWCSCLV